MQLLTYNEVLTLICDFFDSLISPKKLSRSNANIIYLIFKAIAKGFEIINNVCVALSNKYDPANCAEEDLESVASIVGTERLSGSSSGLRITIVNNAVVPVKILAGQYYYDLDAETRFVFTLLEDLTVSAQSSETVTALSEKKGSFPVTTQSDITVVSMNESIKLDENLTFACSENSSLLGYTDETILEFRKRILSDTNRQDIINELQTKIRNLPYIYDCNAIFNDSNLTLKYPSAEEAEFEIPPYHLLLILSGDLREEIAKIVAEHGIYPTTGDENSVELKYYNSVFAKGYYGVKVNEFKNFEYKVKVYYKYDDVYFSEETVQSTLRTTMFNVLNRNVHTDTITEEDIYQAINSSGIEGIKILNVDLFIENENVGFIEIPKTRFAKLEEVTFEVVD